MARGPLRVAILGMGPKGLFSLERLVAFAAGAVPAPALSVDIYEPHPAPGAGPVYDPAQPGYLRLNVPADLIELWPDRRGAEAAASRLSFVEWRRVHDPTGRDEAYPPRADVGRYLVEGLAAIRRSAPPSMAITLHRSAARSLRRRGDGWVVTDDEAPRIYDEVLVTVGHGTGAPDPGAPTPAYVPAVFPVTRWLTPTRVAPASTVAVRGFALTFIDAALALTEGRGGTFTPTGHPYRLAYAGSPGAVASILPFSRTGRPMHAKPDARVAAGIAGLDETLEAGRRRILGRPAGGALDPVLAALADVGAGALIRAGEPGDARRISTEIRARLDAACRGADPVPSADPATTMRASIEVGAGRRPPDLAWALGATWRGVYPAMVASLGARELGAAEWPAFRRLSSEMERLAFGPPLVNAAKVLALIDAGVIDLTHVAGGRVRAVGGADVIGVGANRRRVDAVIDGVLGEPGAGVPGSGLVATLVEVGHARVADGRRGVEIADDGTCVGRDGRPTEGLAVIGRATEDWVVGNDTLSRRLHAHPERWARRVVEAASRSIASPRVAAA